MIIEFNGGRHAGKTTAALMMAAAVARYQQLEVLYIVEKAEHTQFIGQKLLSYGGISCRECAEGHRVLFGAGSVTVSTWRAAEKWDRYDGGNVFVDIRVPSSARPTGMVKRKMALLKKLRTEYEHSKGHLYVVEREGVDDEKEWNIGNTVVT